VGGPQEWVVGGGRQQQQLSMLSLLAAASTEAATAVLATRLTLFLVRHWKSHGKMDAV